MNFYLVFDHYYSGIIQSQVIDLIEAIEDQTDEKFKIIAFVNIKRYTEASRVYRVNASRVLVLPNFGFSRWNWSVPFLTLMAIIYWPKVVVGRSIFANQLALKIKSFGLTKEVVLDARGAEYAEWSEYFFKDNDGPLKNDEVMRLEKKSVEESDRHLAVSEKLKVYWHDTIRAQYNDSNTTIIPSTLSHSFLERKNKWAARAKIRMQLGILQDEVLIVFSGSNSDWHSVDKVITYCDGLLEIKPELKFLFLTNAEIDTGLYPRLAERLIVKWVGQKQVIDFLLASDYGLLVRNTSVTSQVSSPVKFAEYLATGNRIIISDNIGDFSKLVSEQNLGVVVNDWKITEAIEPFQEAERERLSEIGYSMFSKSNFLRAYLDVFLGLD